MTYEEAEICFEKGFPVVCVRAPHMDCEYMVGQTYELTGIYIYFPRDNIKHDIYRSFEVKQNGYNIDSSVTLKPEEMKPLNSFNIPVQKFLKSRKSAEFRDLIKEFLAAGATQTRIIEKVKSVIKEIKISEVKNDLD